MGGLILVRAVSNVPLSYLIIYPAIRSLDSHLEEASKIAGHGYLKTLLRVDVPLIRPAIVASFILAVIGGVNNFDFPYIIGGPARIQTLSTNLYFYVVQRVPPSFGDGAIVGIFFAIISTILVTIYLFATKDRFKFQVITGKSRTQTFNNVGKWKYVALLVCLSRNSNGIFHSFWDSSGHSFNNTLLKWNWRDTMGLSPLFLGGTPFSSALFCIASDSRGSVS